MMLDIHDLNGGYGEIKVLRGVNLTVEEGEFVALFGPNGHGKSTLLKAVSGVHPSTGGSISFMDEEISKLPAHQIVGRGIAYIPEERYLFADMTVLENLRLGAYSHAARKTIDDNLGLVYEVFPRLKERTRQLCHTLSGGESRMVAIARGLMSGAKLLMIDEPSIGLAPGLKKTVYGAIRRIHSERRMTILLVEQEIGYALKMANRAYFLKKGVIQFERPASQVAADEIKEAYF